MRSYSQRLLQPFRGLQHVVEIDGADAISNDGLLWELAIQLQEGGHLTGGDELYAIQAPDLCAGKWSPHAGLTQSLIPTGLHEVFIQEKTEALIAEIERQRSRLPFPRLDYFECWLFDEQNAPLALIDTALDHDATDSGAPPLWTLGQCARETFCSGREDRCRHLIRLVNGAEARVHRWLRREPDGSGFALSDPSQRWAADSFPRMLVRDVWSDADDHALVNEFLRWQSPVLLTLPELTQQERERLEAAAWEQVMKVAEHYRGYPTVIDQDGLKAALVEAHLCRALDKSPAIDSI